MRKATSSPSKYIQGKNELQKLCKTIAPLGAKSALILADPFILNHYGGEMASGFAEHQMPVTMVEFGGECSKAEVDRVTHMLKEAACDVVLGVGGGKTLDTAKAVSHYAHRPVVIVPTAASSDAPCSALSVLYHGDGTFDRYLPLKRNPDMVIVDTIVVANAPARLFAAGMGDALATFYEARSCYASRAATMAGGACSASALALARACRDTLFADGYKALLSVEQNVVTPAVENIIEANIYMSGIGFESGGLAAAHALHDGLTILEETHAMLHGEKVAFGTLVHLALENAPEEEIAHTLAFCHRTNLPTSLAMLGVENPTREQLMAVAESSCEKGKPMHNMPFRVTPEDVYAAIILADKIGR